LGPKEREKRRKKALEGNRERKKRDRASEKEIFREVGKNHTNI
jgi:hypothetical protein